MARLSTKDKAELIRLRTARNKNRPAAKSLVRTSGDFLGQTSYDIKLKKLYKPKRVKAELDLLTEIKPRSFRKRAFKPVLYDDCLKFHRSK